MNAERAKAFAGVLAVFLLGAVCGGMGTAYLRFRLESRIFRAKDPVAQLVTYRLTQELKLDAAQRERVAEIVGRGRDRFFALQKDVMPAVITVFENGAGEIRTVLRPDQQARYDVLLDERRRALEAVVKKANESVPAEH